jgi:hypothetical protein
MALPRRPSPLICRRLILVSSLAQSHGDPCINVPGISVLSILLHEEISNETVEALPRDCVEIVGKTWTSFCLPMSQPWWKDVS